MSWTSFLVDNYDTTPPWSGSGDADYHIVQPVPPGTWHELHTLSPTHAGTHLWTELGTFTVSTLPNLARLQLKWFAHKGDAWPFHVGSCAYQVKLVKPDLSEVTLTSVTVGAVDENNDTTWDLLSYITVAGTYKVKLYSALQSSWNSTLSRYDQSEVAWKELLLQLDTDPPAATLSTQGTPWSMTSIKVDWSTVARADTYTVYYRKLSVPTWSSVTGLTGINYVLGGLDDSEDYNIKVTATNESGEGPAGPVIVARTNRAWTKTLTETPLFVDSLPFLMSKELLELLNWAEDLELSWVKELLEALGLVDSVTLHIIQNYSQYFTEPVGFQESFFTKWFQPLTQYQPKVLVFQTNKKAYNFQPGSPEGTYDTDDLDLGAPGALKTLDEVTIETESDTLITIALWVSVDAGTSWVYVSQITIQAGQVGHFWPWISGETFRLRFTGAGLDFSRYTVYGIQRGPS